MVVVSDIARKHAPWTTSKVDVANSCPRQYELKHIRRVPEDAIRSENKSGIAAHAVIENRLRGMSAADARRAALEKTPLTWNEQEAFGMYDDPIDAFLFRFETFCKANGVKDVFIEQKWALKLDGSPTRFSTLAELKRDAAKKGAQEPEGSEDDDPLFRGIVDLAAVTRDGDLFIIDHKSGRVDNIKYKKPQLDTYAVLGTVSLPSVGGVRCGINALSNPTPKQLIWDDYVPAEAVRSNYLPWLYMRVNDAAESLGSFEPRPSKRWPCTGCGYRFTCDAYQGL